MTVSMPMRWRPAALAYAWLGGVAFVASLAYLAYFYFVGLRGVDPTTAGWRLEPLFFDLGLFGLFAVHHSLMARTVAKRWLTRWLSPSLERSTYVWTASALLVVTCAVWQHIPGTVYRLEGPLVWLGRGLQILALWLIWKASTALDVLELAGIRQALQAFRAPAQLPTAPSPPREGHGGVGRKDLQTTGPYGIVRHPVYLGWILMVFGSTLMTADRLVFAVLSTAYVVIAIPWEERGLRERFGDEYHHYEGQVRWRLIPGIY